MHCAQKLRTRYSLPAPLLARFYLRIQSSPQLSDWPQLGLGLWASEWSSVSHFKAACSVNAWLVRGSHLLRISDVASLFRRHSKVESHPSNWLSFEHSIRLRRWQFSHNVILYTPMTDTGMDGLFKNQPLIRMQIRSRMGLVMWTGNIHMETERDGYAVYLARSKAPGVCTVRSAHNAAQ